MPRSKNIAKLFKFANRRNKEKIKMKRIIYKTVAALMLSSLYAHAAQDDHDGRCKRKTADILRIAQRYSPSAASLRDRDAKTLVMIADQQAPNGIHIPRHGRDREAFLLAGWLLNQNNIFAASVVIGATKSKNPAMLHAGEALSIVYSPISDNEEEKDTLAQELGALYQKDLAAREALGKLAKEPGMELFIKALVYGEPITEKMALDLMCLSPDPEIFNKADKIRLKLK